MPKPITILGISGSLRKQSYNTALLHAAKSVAGDDVLFETATLHGIPLYDGDLETQQGIPLAVSELKARIIACDGLILATPEYNNGIPGVFKNAIDWLSRPVADIPQVFGNRPVALTGASQGGFGTILSQNAWLPVLKMLKVRQWNGGRLLVSRASKVFNENGEISDDAIRTQLAGFVAGFATFVRPSRDD
jgi:chromate reductase